MQVDELTDVIAPYESHHHYQQKLPNPFDVRKMRVLNIESSAFHRFVHRLNLPALAICCNRVFKPMVKIVGLPDLEVVENPRHFHPLPVFGVECPEVLPDSDVVSYTVLVQSPDSSLADELPVRQKAVDIVRTEQIDVSLHEVNPLL